MLEGKAVLELPCGWLRLPVHPKPRPPIDLPLCLRRFFEDYKKNENKVSWQC